MADNADNSFVKFKNEIRKNRNKLRKEILDIKSQIAKLEEIIREWDLYRVATNTNESEQQIKKNIIKEIEKLKKILEDLRVEDTIYQNFIKAFDNEKAINFNEKFDLLLFFLVDFYSLGVLNIEDVNKLIGASIYFNINKRKQNTKNSDNVYFYEPEKKKQYVPSDILNPGVLKVDEENIPDKEYSDTLELAMKNPDIDISPEDDYMRNMDKIIKEFKSDRYIAVYFISEKGETEAATTFAKFKIKEIDGKEKYVFLTKVSSKSTKDAKSGIKTSKGIALQLGLSDALQDLNVNPGNRFVYGVVPDDSVYSLKVEGQEPDEIVHFTMLGKDYYLWYYLNLNSDYSGDTLSYEIKE